jgi:hypothetical protein
LVKFKINSSKLIKAEILRDHERYELNSLIMENFETADLASWSAESELKTELLSATDVNQAASFPELYRVAKEGRLHFPAGLDDLASELATFTYTRRKSGQYSFGHASQKFHDDCVYALNWAIFSLRKEVLHAYELDSIMCQNRSGARRNVCFLLGGGLELFCKERCAAYARVEEMYRAYKKYSLDSDLQIVDFFHAYVKVSGAVIYQAV